MIPLVYYVLCFLFGGVAGVLTVSLCIIGKRTEEFNRYIEEKGEI